MIQLHHGWGSHPSQTASHINSRYTKFLRYLYAVLRAYGCTLLYCSTGQVGPRFCNSGSPVLVEWKKVVEDDIHLRLYSTSILDIHKVFGVLVCCLTGIWGHPYIVPPAKLANDFGVLSHFRSVNDATTLCLRLIFTSDYFPHPY